MKQALAVLLLVNLLRLAFGFAFELVPQEAYYFYYSQHLSLSYFDHPPAIAWFLRLFTSVLGATEPAIRLTAFSLTLGTQACFLLLARRFLPCARRPRALLLFGTTLLVSVLSLISLPDVPLLLFWSLSLIQLARALFDDKRWGWVLGGLFMGLAFDSKYTAVFLQAGLVLFLLASSRHRRFLRTPWPYLSLGIAHLAMAPVYIWNAQHGFASFLFQSAGRAHDLGLPTGRFFVALLTTQSALLLPPLFVGLAGIVFRRLRLAAGAGRPAREKPLFLMCFAAPLFLFFFAVSLFSLVKPNWLMPAYVTGVLLVARSCSPRLLRWNLGFSAAGHAGVAAVILLFPNLVQSDDTWLGWRELAGRVAALKREHPGAFVFSDDGYKTSAELSFYLRDKTYGPNILGKPALHMDYVGDDLSALEHRDALFIDSARRDRSPRPSGQTPALLADRFASVEELAPVLIRLRGEVVRKFFVYLCRDYRLRPAGALPAGPSPEARMGGPSERGLEGRSWPAR